MSTILERDVRGRITKCFLDSNEASRMSNLGHQDGYVKKKRKSIYKYHGRPRYCKICFVPTGKGFSYCVDCMNNRRKEYGKLSNARKLSKKKRSKIKKVCQTCRTPLEPKGHIYCGRCYLYVRKVQGIDKFRHGVMPLPEWRVCSLDDCNKGFCATQNNIQQINCSKKCTIAKSITTRPLYTYKPKPPKPMSCLYCGNEYIREVRGQRYCNVECKELSKYIGKSSKIRYNNCHGCNVLLAVHYKSTRYCDECLLENKRERARANMREKRANMLPMDRLLEAKKLNIRKKRREHRLKELPSTLTYKQWNDALDHFGYKCAYCGKNGCELHKEHFIPAVKGGGYTADNIIPSCNDCNQAKFTALPEEWLPPEKYQELQAYLSARK